MKRHEIRDALFENAELGYIKESGVDEYGEPTFQLTEKGRGYVEGLASGKGLTVDELMASMGLPV